MKNNALRFIKDNRLIFGLALITISYGVFFTYFCTAKPDEPNNIVIDQNRISESAQPDEPNNHLNVKERNKDIPSLSELFKDKKDIIGPEFYLCEIVSFYERVITILFGLVSVLLVLSFIYVHRTSKQQAEDMAAEALESNSFKKSLSDLLKKEFHIFRSETGLTDVIEETELRNEQIEEIFKTLEDNNMRLNFLEKVITEKDYPGDSLKEQSNGNN